MQKPITKKKLEQLLHSKLLEHFDTDGSEASYKIIYEALSMVVNDILIEKRRKFTAKSTSQGRKRVYYLCMEFLLGRSLKNNLYNLGLHEDAAEIVKSDFGANLANIFEQEPDAGLGNGGLGRLAACYMDSLATMEYPATGYGICYEFGMFKQSIIDGWQTELPDNWIPGGKVWLNPRTDKTTQVNFGGKIEEFWDDGYHHINHTDYHTVEAVPYDMFISGYDSQGVSKLRLFKAQSPGLDMDSFNSGDYIRAMSKNAMGEIISKVLYPNDNHPEGKLLRLQQQYFLVCASIADIVDKHIKTYGTMENLAEKVAIHINDTHPAMAILELMRVLLDDCGYSWEKAYNITLNTFAYTNHTIMTEALEIWNEDLFKSTLPRLHQIVCELNNRFCREMYDMSNDSEKTSRMSIIDKHNIKMAHLSVVASHSVNGVSKIHSDILKNGLFHDFYTVTPNKFINVTNGIATRRWLYQSNPLLSNLLSELVGVEHTKHPELLIKLRKYENDSSVLDALGKIKLENKKNIAKYILEKENKVVDPNSVLDVQIKRLHEYKRQHLNALHIISLYQKLLENPDLDMVPRTFVFAAKAAPGYYLAKKIIQLICKISDEIEKNPKIREKIRVIFLENYNVTLSELLMPASEVSEQISLAGTEASGTGNMKMMLNGALTIGTLDGANVEMSEECGKENMFIFGMLPYEVTQAKRMGYSPQDIYNNNEEIRNAVDLMYNGIGGSTFEDVANSIKIGDRYMVLKDFDSYKQAHIKLCETYKQPLVWNKMSLHNIAGAGFFSSDRAIQDYARDIWHLD